MGVRGRIERRDISLGELRESAETTEDVVSELFDRLLDGDLELPVSERRHLEESFERLANGEWDEAAGVLRERYESLCETHHPDGERAACHLNGLPEDIDEQAVDRDERRK